MIRDYVEGDLEKIEGNEFLRERTVYVKDFKNRESFTIEIDGKVVMIFSYKAYAPRRYTIYMEIDKSLDRNGVKEARRHWRKGLAVMNPIRVETTSIANKVNDRFHRFMGMTLEGTKKNYLDGEDYNVWGCVWDG